MEKNTAEYNLEETDRKYYEGFHQSLSNAIIANESEYNKKIFYVSTGVVAFSVTFISDLFGPEEIITGIVFLILAWIGFVGAIITHILSYLNCISVYAKRRSQFAEFLEKDRNKITCDYEARKDKEEGEKLIKGFHSDNKMGHVINWLTAIFFFVGLAMFITFASINLINTNKMKDDNKPSEVVEKKVTAELGIQAVPPCPISRSKIGDSVSAAPPTPIAKTSQPASSDTSASTAPKAQK